MIKMKKMFVLVGVFLILASSSLGVLPVSAVSMTSIFGTNFGSDFGLVVDLNQNSASFDPTQVQVLADLGNPSNPVLNPVDQNPWYDQQFFFSHMNVSNVDNIYLALNKLEFNITLNIGTHTVNFGHVNGSAPFQSLLQFFQSNGKNVLVANTFRGLVAYTTNQINGTLNINDHAYFGYSFVEQHLIDLINGAITTAMGNGCTKCNTIPSYGFSPIYVDQPTNHTFGMIYTNYLVVWQNATSSAPGALSSYAGSAFSNVATGGQMVAASLFKYLKFTYQIETVSQNSTMTVVNVVTKYDLGPMEWLITTENNAAYTNILTHDTNINVTNSFHTPAQNLDYIINTGLSTPLPSQIDVIVPIPELSFYTSSAVPERINAAAMQTAGAKGMGIAVASSTNAIVLGSTVNAPAESTDSQNINIPLSFGTTHFFTTNFNQKSTYTRYFPDGSSQPNLPVFITTRAMGNLGGILDTATLVKPYFEIQSLQTLGIALYSAVQLNSGFVQNTGLSIDSTAYVTFVQMPEWSGYQVTQDPTFSAVSAVSAKGSSTTTGIPGFEFYGLMLAAVPIYLISKKSKKT